MLNSNYYILLYRRIEIIDIFDAATYTDKTESFVLFYTFMNDFIFQYDELTKWRVRHLQL